MATKIGNALRSLMERSGKLRSATSLKWLHSDRYLFLIGVGKDAICLYRGNTQSMGHLDSLSRTKQKLKRVKDVVAQESEETLRESLLDFHYANKLDLTESNIFRIAKAAIQGRVKRLLIAGELAQFGKWNHRTGDFVLDTAGLDREDNRTLFNIAHAVLVHGGRVIVASQKEVPGGHSILAIIDPLDPEMSTKKSTLRMFQPTGLLRALPSRVSV